jgi:hypothetical protein
VTGNNIYLTGDSVVSAVGSVVVVRPELTATGDSLFANSGIGLLRLVRTPKIVGTKGRPFTLVGETIDLLTRRRKLDRVVAKSAAVATSEDLEMRADTIDLRVTDDLLQRAIAWGASRARATSPTQTMIADSIDVLLPRQRVRELFAIRRASAEGAPDTTHFHTTEKDRLTGDTILAHFDTVAATDTSRKPRIRQLVAIGTASALATSLQHLPARDSSVCLPAVSYVRGRRITVSFDSAAVSRVDVANKELASSLYLEPNPDSTARCRRAVAATTTAGPSAGRTPAGSLPTPAPTSPPASTPVAPPPSTPPRRP